MSAAGESGVHCWGMRERGACGGSLTPASRTHMSTPTMSTVKSASNGLERTEPSAPRSRASNPIPREIAYCTRTYCTLLTGTGATCTCSTSTVPLPLPYYVVRLYPATAKAHTHQLPPPVGFSKTASQGALPLPLPRDDATCTARRKRRCSLISQVETGGGFESRDACVVVRHLGWSRVGLRRAAVT